ncbi:MAG: phosphotransferase family protein [Actinomycetota bacterium]
MGEDLEHLVSSEGLSRFLSERFGPSGAELEVERLGEGHSNLNFLVRRGGEQWVLRRPPRGQIQAGTHEMHREFGVMKALSDAGMPVPVPPPVDLCRDDSYIGAPFYLMEHVDGVVIRGPMPDAFGSPTHRRGVGMELADKLADIHAVDWRNLGLESMARNPEEFLTRNLMRMQQLYDGVRHREMPEIDDVASWLRANTPKQRDVTLTHGDYKLDNVMYAPKAPPRIVAVVDWEISTIGDPLVDLGWMLYFSPETNQAAATPIDQGAEPGGSGVSPEEGYPSRAELAERYAERTGRAIEDLRFYCAFAGWKIAIIMEGSNYRFKQGMADDSMFSALDAVVPMLAQRSLQLISGESPVGV